MYPWACLVHLFRVWRWRSSVEASAWGHRVHMGRALCCLCESSPLLLRPQDSLTWPLARGLCAVVSGAGPATSRGGPGIYRETCTRLH